MPRVLAGLLLLTAALAAAPPQAADPGTQALTLRGRVAAEENDAVLRRVRVAASIGTARMPPVLTDDEGRFAVALPASSALTVTFSKAGFATTTVTLTPAALPRDLTVRLARGAVVTGRLIDPAGGP